MTGDRQTEAARAAWVNGGIAAKPEAAERRGGLPLCAARSHSRRRDQTAALEPKPPLPQRLAGRSGSGLVWHRARSEQQPGKPAGMSILVRDLSGFGGMLYPSRPTRTSRPSAGTTQRAPAQPNGAPIVEPDPLWPRGGVSALASFSPARWRRPATRPLVPRWQPCGPVRRGKRRGRARLRSFQVKLLGGGLRCSSHSAIMMAAPLTSTTASGMNTYQHRAVAIGLLSDLACLFV